MAKFDRNINEDKVFHPTSLSISSPSLMGSPSSTAREERHDNLQMPAGHRKPFVVSSKMRRLESRHLVRIENYGSTTLDEATGRAERTRVIHQVGETLSAEKV